MWFDRGAVALTVCSAERVVHVEFHPQAVSLGTLRGECTPERLWSRVRAAFDEYIHSCAPDAVQFVMTEHPPIDKVINAAD